MELKPEQLAARGTTEPLYPVYLIAGPETLRVLEAADAVRAQARAQGIGEREVFDADGRDFDWGQLEASFNAPSLFSARRQMEVRLPGGKPGKEGAEVISAFCANPPPDVVLLITAGEWGKAYQGKWSDAIARVGVVAVAWAIKPHELPGWIESRLRSKGLRADRGFGEQRAGALFRVAGVPSRRVRLQQLVALVAEQAAKRVVHLEHASVGVDHAYPVARRAQQRLVTMTFAGDRPRGTLLAAP